MTETGESSAAIIRRMDERSWADIRAALLAGATLIRPTRMRAYDTDEQNLPGGTLGRKSLSATRVKKLEAEGILRQVGVDRYGLVRSDDE